MIKIPGELGWVQDNQADTLGSIKESFNIDPESNRGRIRTTRTKRVAYTGSPTGFGEIAAMDKFDGTIYVASEHSSAHDIWAGGNTPFDSFTNDPTSIEIVPNTTDIKGWNNGLYAATGNEMFYSTDGAAWTEIGANVLTSGDPHLLESLNQYLYVTDQDYKVFSVTTGNAFQGSGSQTLNLNLPGYTIMMLSAGIDQIWIGLSNIDGGVPSLVFEWDGTTANTTSARYEIQASGIMAGIVKDGVPYLVDSLGRLMRFNGGVFVEVARFPLNGGTFKGWGLAQQMARAIHPRGMAIDGDEILITVSNRTDGITSENYNEFPSGVWAYSEKNGLYHKYSPSYQAVADTGTTNLTDYGQYRTFSAGPMMVVESVAVGGDTVASNGGRVMFAMEYFIDADDTSADTQWGLFTDDTNDNTQKAGWYISPRIDSAKFRDVWEKLYPAISDLETSGDLVEIKYRTKDETPTYFSGTWTGTDRISTLTELTNHKQGDEITIVHGKGAGAVVHATLVSSGAGSEVVFDRSITGITVGQTSKFKIEKWKKIAKVTDTEIFDRGYTIGATDHWIQIKIYMQWTGKRELYSILVNNIASIS